MCFNHKKSAIRRYFIVGVSLLNGDQPGCFINCISQSILTSLLTTTWPASVTASHSSLKSFLLIFPSMVKPAWVCPHGSVTIPPNSTSSVIGLVISRIVRSPSSLKELPDFSYFLPVNFSWGNCSAAKKIC